MRNSSSGFKGIYVILSALIFKSLLFSNVALAYPVVKVADAGVPLTVFSVVFRVGSADDPKEAKGTAALAAALVREGGLALLQIGKGKTAKTLPPLTRAQLEEALFPLAASIGVQVSREQTTFRVMAPAGSALKVFDYLSQMLLAPALDAGEFERLKAAAVDMVAKRAPSEDQEELGKTALEWLMYGPEHPYAHDTSGTVSGIKNITPEKLAVFIKEHYTQKRLTAGVAGVVSPAISAEVSTRFKLLPAGTTERARIPEVALPTKMKMLIVKGAFGATGVHFGLPVNITRSSPDFADMYLVSQAFGKHRSFVGRLMRVVREVRSLNYGAYSYVEEFPNGGSSLSPPTQVARTRQAFTVWARPTPVENGCFMARQVHRELKNLTDLAPKGGLTEDEFNVTKSHVIGATPLLATSIDDRLGYAMDSLFYGVKGDYLKGLQEKLKQVTRSSANRMVRAHVDPNHVALVVVTPEPEKFKKAILSERCNVTYPSGIEKAQDVVAEDQIIAQHKLPLKEQDIQIIEAEELFK